jgi:hypothetical protein
MCNVISISEMKLIHEVNVDRRPEVRSYSKTGQETHP